MAPHEQSTRWEMRARFVIREKGRVLESEIVQSDLKKSTLHNCRQKMRKEVRIPLPTACNINAVRAHTYNLSE